MRRAAGSVADLPSVWTSEETMLSLAQEPWFSRVADSVGVEVPEKPDPAQIRAVRMWLARSISRATPLGEASGVDAGRVTDEPTQLVTAPPLRRAPVVGEQLVPMLRWSPFALESAERIWVEKTVSTAGRSARESVSVPRTRVIEEVARHASSPRSVADLVSHLVGLFPSSSSERVRAAVDDLCDQGFLVDARNATQIVPTSPVPSLVHTVPLRLSWQMADRASGLIEALDYRSATGDQKALGAYTDRFVERFGPDELIPLREVVAPRGIGAYDAAFRARHLQTSERELVAELARFSATAVNGEAHLTREWIDRFRAASEWDGTEATMPLDVVLEPLEDSDGRPLWYLPATAFRQARTTSARLMLGQDSSTVTAGQAIERWWKRLGHRVADLSVVPQLGEHLDLVARPRELSREIVVGAGGGARQIELADLLVEFDGVHLRAVDGRSGERVLPLHFSAYNPALLHPAYEFLAALHQQHVRQVSAFDWGVAATNQSSMPRVRFGEDIVAAAQWRVPKSVRTSDDFTEWGRLNGLPRYLTVQDGDRKVVVDSRSSAGRSYLASLARRSSLALSEAFVDGVHPLARDAGSRRYVSEIVLTHIPAIRAESTAQPAVRSTPGSPASAKTQAAPGWATLKLYAPSTAHNSLLRGRLGTWFSEKWAADSPAFFLRYKDPDSHLRVRCRRQRSADAAQELYELGAEIADEVPIVRRFVIEPYYPELQRYEVADRGAEELFSVFGADARLALATATLPGLHHDSEGDMLCHAALLWEYQRLSERRRDLGEPSDGERARLKTFRSRLSTLAKRWDGECSLLELLDTRLQEPVADLRSAITRFAAARGPLSDQVLESLGHLSLNRAGCIGEHETTAHRAIHPIDAARRSRRAFLSRDDCSALHADVDASGD
ncbi:MULTISPECIES: thiopeptide-type bacteriocin biosynthesis protein [unclassified Microbacterium]|uniref:thiopeptide-type bacteriocin biosynthesis protein n=1 Tax=unclassified Microbacterium TaxID=2609290 RepID=UPI0027E0517A|nr:MULTISPECIES: thiopeptide-type bacteriocin biosynthesis protein [unclassified Microbacterium]